MDWRRKLRAKTLRLNRKYRRDVYEKLSDGLVPYKDADALMVEAIADSIKEDCARFRALVLNDVWLALRDDAQGPHYEAMRVVMAMHEGERGTSEDD